MRAEDFKTTEVTNVFLNYKFRIHLLRLLGWFDLQCWPKLAHVGCTGTSDPLRASRTAALTTLDVRHVKNIYAKRTV